MTLILVFLELDGIHLGKDLVMMMFQSLVKLTSKYLIIWKSQKIPVQMQLSEILGPAMQRAIIVLIGKQLDQYHGQGRIEFLVKFRADSYIILNHIEEDCLKGRCHKN